MTIKFYKHPKRVGWIGWVEGKHGKTIGFVKLNGIIQFGW